MPFWAQKGALMDRGWREKGVGGPGRRASSSMSREMEGEGAGSGRGMKTIASCKGNEGRWQLVWETLVGMLMRVA